MWSASMANNLGIDLAEPHENLILSYVNCANLGYRVP